LGTFAQQNFSESTIDCEGGDILLIITDGLTEVFNKSGAELGLEPLKSAFVKNAGLPLEKLFVELRSVATGFGAQSDDQTMLLARYLG
jgi:phosphoserine phosphatase RsbU/P